MRFTEPSRGHLQLAVRDSVGSAEHRLRESGADRGKSVTAHENHVAAAEVVGERPSELRVADEKIGAVARISGDVESRRSSMQKAARMRERTHRDVDHGER